MENLNLQSYASTGVNGTINFQGKVVNSDGTNVADGQYTFVFKIYDAPTGGSNPWTETQNNVTVTAGIFRVSLGSVTPISGVDFNTDNIYLGINFNSDGEMTPRVRFASVPYALNAQKVAGLTVTNTTGTLTIPNSKTVQFGGAFTTSAQDLTLTLSGTTNVTLPTTGTLSTLAGVENLSNKTFTNSITLSGAGSNLVLANSESISNDTNGTITFGRNDAGTVILTAADNDATAALTIQSGGASNLTLDTGGAGILNLGTTNATSAVLGSSSLASLTVTANGTGDSKVVLPGQSIGSSEIVNNTIGFGQIADALTLDADTTVSFSTSSLILDLTSTGDFLIRDAGNNFAQFLDDGTITLGKSATANTLNLGIGTGADTINIGSNNTVGDTLTIGNNNASTTVSLTGGTVWSVTTAGAASFASLAGAGLVDCDAATSKLLWNDATGTFSCGTDLGSNLQVVSFTDSTTEVATFTSAMDIWDGTYPNITPGATTSNILVSVNIRGTSDDANDHNPVFTIRRAIGSNPNCSSTQVGGEFVGGFLTTTGQDWGASVTFSDAPASTGNVRYTVCTTTTGLDDANTDVVTVVLTEIGSSSAGGGSGSITVRESDTSPSVSSVSTLEFGPGSTSSDEFIVTNEGGGVARVRIGDQVGILNQAETVTGGWTFNTGSTTFTTSVLANGGLTTTSGTDLTLTAAGTGDVKINLDADTNFQIIGGAASGVDLVSLSNSGFGTTTNGVDGLQIDFATAAVVGARTNAGIQLNLTSGATEASDTLYGINIGNITGQTGTETAINIGTGWDSAINTNGGNITAGSGTIFASNFDGVGAVALGFGSGDITSITLTTDGTGDSELVLPDQSVGAAEIVDNSIDASKIASTLTFSDGDLIDLSPITHGSSSPQGLILPQASSLTNPSSGEGYIAWNSSTNLVQVFDGANWIAVGAATDFDEVYAKSVLNTNTTMEINDSLGLAFDLTTTGDFSISDNGTPFAQFANDGTITLGKSSAAGTINIGSGTGIDTINIGTGATGADVISIGGGAGTLGIDTTNFTLTTAGLVTLYDTLELSTGTNQGIRGGGLSDCDGPTDKLQWDSTTNKFSCGTDSNVIAVFDAYDNTGGQNISTGVTVNLDTERKNSDATMFSLSSDVLTINQAGTYTFQFRVGATLTAGTRGAIRAYMEEDTGSGFAEIDGTRAYAYGRITTYPEATAVGFFTMDVASGSAYRVRSLVEAGTFSTVADGSSLIVSKVDGVGGTGGGATYSLTVRESDTGPSVSDVDTLEFGPASTSSDEFIVTNEGGGVARVRIGNQVGMLNEAETVTGGWTFDTGNTTFTTAVNLNGGLTTSITDQNLAFSANGTGDFVFNVDSDTNVLLSGGSDGTTALGISAGDLVLSDGDFVISGGDFSAVLDAGDTFDITKSGAAAGNVFAITASSVNSINGINIDLASTIDSGADTYNGINFTWTESTDADIVNAINIGNTTAVNSVTTAINIGTGWGTGILVNSGGVAISSGGLTVSSGGIALNGGNLTSTQSTLTIDAGGTVSIADNLTVTGTTGITLSGTGADLVFANSESITNDTDGTITLHRNNAGTVTLNATDDDSTAALTITSGGAAALTLDAGGAAAIAIGTTNASSVTVGNTTGSNSYTLNSGTGGINIGDNATTKAIEIGGVDNNGADTIRIATNATSADSITVGNANSSTTMALTGGTSWSISSAGNFTGAAGSFTTGAFSDQISASNKGIEFTESDTNPTCAAGNYTIYADNSDGRLKKCQNGVVSDLAQDSDVINRAKSADQSVTNSTTLANETALQFTIAAGEEWNVYWNLSVTNNNSATPDLKMAVKGPTGTTCRASISGSEPAGAAFPEATTTDCTTPGTLVNNTIVADANVPFPVNVLANIQAGGTAGTVTLQFAENTGGAGTSLTIKEGSIMNAYRVTGADLAEIYYTDDPTIASGDVISLNKTKATAVNKAARKYDPSLLGIVSTKPGLVLSAPSNNQGYPVMVALSGRVPVKVSTENGEIKAGDYLTSSSVPGVAMKATKAGPTIGIAMTDYDSTEQGTVLTFIKSGYYTGTNSIQEGLSTGESNIAKSILSNFLLRPYQGDNFDASEVVADRISAFELITPKLVADAIASNNLTVNQASVSGVLTVDTLRANKIEGLEFLESLNASKGIDYKQISDNQKALEDQMASLSARLDSMGAINLLKINNSDSTDIVTVDNFASFGTTTLSEVSILNSLSIGSGSSMNISENSINVVGSDLSIQPLKQGGVSFLGGAVKFSPDGTAVFEENVEFRKDVLVSGVLSAQTVRATDISFGQSIPTQISDDEYDATSAAGLITLKNGKTKVRVNNPLVKDSSYIFITPKSNTSRTLFLLEQSEEKDNDKAHFEVGIDRESGEDIKFNYLIVN